MQNQNCNSVRIRIRQRPQEKAIQQTEHSGVDAHTQGKRKRDRQAEARILVQLPQCQSQVLNDHGLAPSSESSGGILPAVARAGPEFVGGSALAPSPKTLTPTAAPAWDQSQPRAAPEARQPTASIPPRPRQECRTARPVRAPN